MNRELLISGIDEDPAQLRERFQTWGYLYFRQYFPASECAALLRDILSQCAPHIGFSDERQCPVLTAEPFFETDPTWDEIYPRIQSLESFHSFFHAPAAAQLMHLLAGEALFVYPMKMARISTPGKIGCETPPHQDAHSHRAGPTMAGIWVALHDIEAAMGRLKVLPKSHRQGVRPVFEAGGVGGVQCEIYEHETTWHTTDHRRGDVLLFHSCCVHKAEPNRTEDVCRFSVDTRFCDYGAPVFSTNTEPHHGWRIEGLDWESIYAGWQRSELCYYWKDYPALHGPGQD